MKDYTENWARQGILYMRFVLHMELTSDWWVAISKKDNKGNDLFLFYSEEHKYLNYKLLSLQKIRSMLLFKGITIIFRRWVRNYVLFLGFNYFDFIFILFFNFFNYFFIYF